MNEDGKGNQLRDRADDLLSEHIKSDMPISDDFLDLVHELQTYQIELEMQNEELRRTGNELEESRKKYFDLYEFAPVGYFSLDKNGIINNLNLTGASLLGIEKKHILKSAFIRFIETDYRRDFYNHLKKIHKTGSYDTCELVLTHKGGKPLNTHLKTIPIQDKDGNIKQFITAITDITDLKKAEDIIQKSLEEKEMLLKEIHHRVKNNLMIISSLLDLQSQHIIDKTSQNIFKESQNRARSMALIHERLYESTDLKKIDFGDYIRTLSTELFRTYAGDFGLIELKINVEDIMMDINTSIPLGLIVNELVTNSLKHAFPEGMKGEINIDFHHQDDYYQFTVKDNGIGFPNNLDFQKTDSLGLKIVNILTQQIDGTIELNRSHGTEFKITLKEIEYK
jgi:PAS domain S-box-containing protein